MEKLVASSAKNLLDYSTYLSFAFGSDQRRNRTVISLHTGAETRRQCFKSQEKPAESFAARKNGAAQLLRKNSIDLWSIPSTSFDAARPNGKTLSRDATESCIRCRRMRKKKKKQPAMNTAKVSHGTNSQKASKVNGRGCLATMVRSGPQSDLRASMIRLTLSFDAASHIGEVCGHRQASITLAKRAHAY